jgi:hypothetical protein
MPGGTNGIDPGARRISCVDDTQKYETENKQESESNV